MRKGRWLLLLIVSVCAHSGQVELSHALSLETVSAPRSLVAGQSFAASFRIHNLTRKSLNLCSAGGVSMLLRSSSRTWPLEQHGITTDTACSAPVKLRPGESTLFTERGVVPRNWSPGKSSFVGSFTAWLEGAAETSQLVSQSAVIITPPN
jgi:hypothetical protein